MSMPITFCSVVKATQDEEEYQLLLKKVEYNRRQVAWTYLPCKCDIKCECPQEELDKLNTRIRDDLKKRREFYQNRSIKIPLFDISSAVDLIVKNATDANWDSLNKAYKILNEGFKAKPHTEMARKLLNLMKKVVDKND